MRYEDPQAPDYARELADTVHRAAERLAGVSSETVSHRPAPGAWSIKEIIGHLVDSASNNHQRFVRAQWQDDLVFLPYDQDRWVDAQRYQEAPWPELLALWRTFNLHIARVMAATPPETRLRTHGRHNLDELAWQPVPAGAPATLDGFMRDYVGHLHHHLAQVDAILERTSL